MRKSFSGHRRLVSSGGLSVPRGRVSVRKLARAGQLRGGPGEAFTVVDQASRHHDRASTLGYRAAKQQQRENEQAAGPESTAA